MVNSINTKIDVENKATSFLGFTSYGTIMIGDKGFEYYSSRNANDYIQIPWAEVDKVIASVYFKRWISRFSIRTKKDGTFSFSARDSKKVLRGIREYVGPENILQSLTFFGSLRRAIRNIFSK